MGSHGIVVLYSSKWSWSLIDWATNWNHWWLVRIQMIARHSMDPQCFGKWTNFCFMDWKCPNRRVSVVACWQRENRANLEMFGVLTFGVAPNPVTIWMDQSIACVLALNLEIPEMNHIGFRWFPVTIEHSRSLTYVLSHETCCADERTLP